VLEAARSHTRGRLFCVFGCGGDRDPGKRPLMGAIAESHADVVIVTDDNPRTEASGDILAQIVAGMAYGETVQVIADRADAIQHAIAEADPGDVVVIAGKGHEDYQIVGRDVLQFSDRDAVRRALGEIA
jgi:UDP-N-acetylmuramoyl-L-alanyl-D-glutamate--2,6-diaminopimelate ligase